MPGARLLVLAGGVVVDAAAVETEGWLCRVDTDGQRALGEQRLLDTLRITAPDGLKPLHAPTAA